MQVVVKIDIPLNMNLFWWMSDNDNTHSSSSSSTLYIWILFRVLTPNVYVCSTSEIFRDLGSNWNSQLTQWKTISTWPRLEQVGKKESEKIVDWDDTLILFAIERNIIYALTNMDLSKPILNDCFLFNRTDLQLKKERK